MSAFSMKIGRVGACAAGAVAALLVLALLRRHPQSGAVGPRDLDCSPFVDDLDFVLPCVDLNPH